MLTIFVLPYRRDGSEKKQTSRKAKDHRSVHDHPSDSSVGASHDRGSDAARRENVEPAADPPADRASKKDPRDAVSSADQES